MEDKKAQEYIMEGIKHYENQNYAEAIESYTKAIELEPDDACGYKERGLVYWRLERYNEALSDLDKAIEFDNNDAQIYKARGAVNYFTNQYEKAIADFSRAIELGAGDADLYKFRADVKFTTQEYESALEDYNKAISLDGEYLDAYLARAVDEYFLKKYDEAKADYDYALSLDSECPDIYYARADMYTEMKEFESALADYESAIAYGLDEQCLSNVYMYMGIAHYNVGRHIEALENYNKALDKAGFNIELALEIMSNMVFAYIELGQNEDVVATCSKCLVAKESAYAWLYLTRSAALVNLSRVEEAIEDIRMLFEKWNDAVSSRIDETEMFAILYTLQEEFPDHADEFGELIEQFHKRLI